MYLFFMVTGYIFTVLSSILILQTYNIFSINKLTKFIYPPKETIFNKIGVSLIPILLWSLIEIAILGTNSYFMLGICLNIFLNCSISYIIIYGYFLISSKETPLVQLVSILIANFFGYAINYISLLIGGTTSMLYNIIAIVVFIIVYTIIKLYPPKNEFFRGTKK